MASDEGLGTGPDYPMGIMGPSEGKNKKKVRSVFILSGNSTLVIFYKFIYSVFFLEPRQKTIEIVDSCSTLGKTQRSSLSLKPSNQSVRSVFILSGNSTHVGKRLQ